MLGSAIINNFFAMHPIFKPQFYSYTNFDNEHQVKNLNCFVNFRKQLDKVLYSISQVLRALIYYLPGQCIGILIRQKGRNYSL